MALVDFTVDEIQKSQSQLLLILRTNSIDLVASSSELSCIERMAVRLNWRFIGFFILLLSCPKHHCWLARLSNYHHVRLSLQCRIAYLKLTALFQQFCLLFLIHSIPNTSQNCNYDHSNSCAYSCGNKYTTVDFVVVVAVVVLRITVVVPFGTVSVVIAAFPSAVLKLAVLVIAHQSFITTHHIT